MVGRIIKKHQIRVGAAVSLLLALVIWLRYASLDYFWYAPVFFVYSTALATFLLSRFFISWAHEPPPMTGYTPSISVVISVRNEQDAIARTVDKIYQADYPDHLREVIVVDDGSTDGTAKALEELRKKYSTLSVRSLPPQGKRQAMAAGVRAANGEIIVFVDSDTFIMHDTLRQIVCGFEDPTLGASAGYTGVENSTKNALTGMQEVRYYVSNRLLKSSESIFGCVTCCPGCLSAYRKSYLLEILQTWLDQKFLGLPATFGDDRSLTNFILRKYRVIYNDRAIASTLVPETWGHYMRQQLRWKKSWLRETWIASGFMYKKHPVAVLSFYASSFFSLMSPVMLLRVLFLEGGGNDSVLMFYLTGLVLIALLQSLYFLYKRPSPNWALGMLWMASSLVIMGPQTYYALLTVRKNHWGTR
ncbi:MAG: glycosyltransferase [Elusimicrobiota bacterium]|nr:MAG: glycosyltransferase [Elusimicrobiota bacterium]